MNEPIRNLDDATAIRILTSIASSRLHAGEVETQLTPEIEQALTHRFGAAAGAERLSEGDLARQALLVLAEDPETRQHIEAMIGGPVILSYDVGATLALVTAALVVLQTRVRFERGPAGKISLLIEKEPFSDKRLGDLVQKILTFGKK